MFERYTDLIENLSGMKRDDRVKESFLMSSPIPTLILIALYLLTAKFFLPIYMKYRLPFKVDRAIYYYNIFQVILSAYIVYLGYGSGWIRRFPVFKCREVDRSPTDSDAIMAMNATYIYFLAKFSEFPDTIFFLLRKKYNQVSFLHLYHHASMPLNAWLVTRFVPGGSTSMAVGTNSAVHVVMYSYYLLAGLGPQWQKYLWWKKYLTAFQLVQFIFGLYQICLIIFGDCVTFQSYKPLFVMLLLYVASLLILFGKFYHNSYNKKQNQKSRSKKAFVICNRLKKFAKILRTSLYTEPPVSPKISGASTRTV